jgi:flagellar hook-associated protein 3 FlgL
MLRVTVGSSSYAALQGLQENASRLQKLQSQLSSGKQITAPSDDPSGTIQALQLRGQTARNDQYATNATDAIAFMSTADTAYQQIQTLVQQARTLVVQGLNTGASTGTSNAAIADQIDAIKRSVLALANTTYNNQPVFGGTTNQAQAYDAAGTYIGDGNSVTRQVGPATTVTVNQTGTDVFGAASADPTHPSATNSPDLFQLLTNVSAALRGDPTAPPLAGDPATGTPSALEQLDAARQRVSTAQAAEGATYKQVENAQAVQASTKVSLATQLSSIQDIDLPELAVQVSTAQVTYQAALQTTAGIQQMSLLNFLN